MRAVRDRERRAVAEKFRWEGESKSTKDTKELATGMNLSQ